VIPFRFKRIFFVFLSVFSLTSGLSAQVAFRDSISLLISKEKSTPKKLDWMLNICANYINASLFDSAFAIADKGIQLSEDSKDNKHLASFYTDKGAAYLMQGSNGFALECFLKELKLVETLRDTASISACYNTMGIIYLNMKEYDKSLVYLTKSIRIVRGKGDGELWVDYYGNLGFLYASTGRYDSALCNMNKAIAVSEKIGDKKKTAISLQNIGDVLIQEKKYREALDYTNRSIAMTAESGKNYGTAQLYLNLGLIYKGLGEYPQAHLNLDKAIEIEKAGESIDEDRQIYQALFELYEQEKNYSKAYKSHLLYTKFNDSIFNRENLSKLSDIKVAYEIDKKEEFARLRENEENLKQTIRQRKEKIVDAGLLGGLCLMLFFAFISYRGYRLKVKSNSFILLQKEEIEKKNGELEEMNREVSDSIQYARRIQEAILPSVKSMQDIIPESFVLFLPKNVVSGDFYFFARLADEAFVIASCDCTGHGVPGAFMSMIGSEQLGKIVRDRGVTKPSEILNELHAGLRKALQQDRNETRDGIDLAICKVNLKERKMEYAGANRPCWIINKDSGAMVELKPDKRPVGGQESPGFKAFNSVGRALQQGDRVYLFSDGFADQFGGDRGKKLMVKNFRKMLVSVAHLSFSEQEKQLNARLADWRGGIEQIDDILVIGFGV
jgi:serine phosphatase RsbU (regulator of sigma subunit)/Tfp pilus assembly protein PilF